MSSNGTARNRKICDTVTFTFDNSTMHQLIFQVRRRLHVSGDFCIRKFFYADTKISASTRSVYESYTTVHTYPILIQTSQRISQQSMRITKKAEPVTSAYTKIYRSTHIRIHSVYGNFHSGEPIQKISGYTECIRQTRVDARCIHLKKFADTKIPRYLWMGPKFLL